MRTDEGVVDATVGDFFDAALAAVDRVTALSHRLEPAVRQVCDGLPSHEVAAALVMVTYTTVIHRPEREDDGATIWKAVARILREQGNRSIDAVEGALLDACVQYLARLIAQAGVQALATSVSTPQGSA